MNLTGGEQPGDFYKKDKADEIVRKEVSDSIMRRSYTAAVG